jgi:hypothetical protein
MLARCYADTTLQESAYLPLFTLNKEVVWGFKNPKDARSTEDTVEKIIKDFIEFVKKHELKAPF